MGVGRKRNTRLFTLHRDHDKEPFNDICNCHCRSLESVGNQLASALRKLETLASLVSAAASACSWRQFADAACGGHMFQCQNPAATWHFDICLGPVTSKACGMRHACRLRYETCLQVEADGAAAAEGGAAAGQPEQLAGAAANNMYNRSLIQSSTSCLEL